MLPSPCLAGKHQTLFNTQDMWTPSNVQLLMMRLTDNYESNKVMAFDLLNGLSQETLGLLVSRGCILLNIENILVVKKC